MTELLEVAEELYAGPLAEFVPARDALAKAAEDKTLGRQVKALRKPTLGAWAINLLVRRETEQLDQVFALAASLREAADSMDGAELRALTRQRRQLTAALATAARSHARDAGTRLTNAVGEQIEGVLNAAMLDPVAADVVRSGLLVTTFTSTGLSELDPASVAVPEAVGHLARPQEAQQVSEAQGTGRPRLSVVRDDTRMRRERAKKALAEATSTLSSATRDLAAIERKVARLDAKRLQLARERDELRRQLADLDDQIEQVEDDYDDEVTARDEASDDVERATAERDAAQQTLDDL